MEPRNETFVNYESDLIHPLTDLDFKYDLPNFGTADSDRLPQLEMAFFSECFTNCGKDIYAFHYLRFPIKEPEWVDACSAHRRTHSFKSTATLSSSFHSLVATPQPLLLIKDTQSESLKEKEKTPFEERELKSMHARQQTLDDVHEAEITPHIDLSTVEEVKAKDYQESFEKVGDELRLKRQAEAEEDQALIALKEKSKCIEHFRQEVDQRDNNHIVDLQQLTDMHTSEMSALWEDVTERTIISDDKSRKDDTISLVRECLVPRS
ncbi:unnamed protein product [Malus baccata var. baccata]